MDSADKALVKSVAEMDTETFLKHMNARHTPIRGMKSVGRSNVPDDEDENLLKAFHDKVHEMGDEFALRYHGKTLDHTHREAPK